MVNTSKKNFSQLPANKYDKSTKHSTRQRHQANKDKSGLQAERVWALGALRSWRSKKKLTVAKWQEMHFLGNEEREKSIEDYVERKTAVATQWVWDPVTATMQEQKHMGNVENRWSTTTNLEITFEEMLSAIWESLSDLASSEDEEDGEDEDDDEANTGHDKLSKDDEPGWVMRTISKTVQHNMESFRQMQMRVDELMQPGWGDATDNFRERDMKYGMTELKVLAVGKPQTDSTAATPSPTTYGELM